MDAQAQLCESTTAISAGICCVDLGRLPGVRQEPPARPASALSWGLIIIPEPSAAEPAEPPVDPKELAGLGWHRQHHARGGRHGGSNGHPARLLQRTLKLCVSIAAARGSTLPLFGVDLDPVSILRDRWDLEHILDVIGESVRHVRGRDAIRGSSGRPSPRPLARAAPTGLKCWRSSTPANMPGGPQSIQWTCPTARPRLSAPLRVLRPKP